MAGPEEKTFVTNSEMLEQVLRNLVALLSVLNLVSHRGLIADTKALLDRLP